jgi:hypothetical protein
MAYNGLGQRLSMDAAGVIAYYVMDGNRPLTATTGSDTTSYLYGLGVIGEESNAWSYSLTDGTNTQRQLTDSTGEVTYSARYTPWGDTLDRYGTGNFTFGYFGGLMDNVTGLLYVGNGQYYDPSTGRFLTRGFNPSSPNPYLPFDPTGALFLPLGLLAMYHVRRKKGSKWGMWMAFLLVAVSVGMGVSSCKFTAVITPTAVQTPGYNYTVTADGETVNGFIPTPSATGTPPPIPCPGTPTPPPATPTPTPTIEATHTDEEWTGIARVVFNEGASSFTNSSQGKQVFTNQLWALRSIRLRQQTGRSYINMVQDCGFMSACASYGSATLIDQWYVQTTKEILSGSRASNEPAEISGKIVHWISPQNFPRYNPGYQVPGNELLFKSSQIPGCEASWCQLPDLRSRSWLLERSIKELNKERFIQLGYLGPSQIRFEQNQYFEECYWIGVFFIEDSKWSEVHAGRKLPPPGAEDAEKLKCP